MVFSAACFALMAAIAKKILPTTPMQSVVFSRGVLMTATFVTLARCPVTSGRCSTSRWVMLQYSHPIFVAAIAPFALREPTARWHWPLVLVALAGVGLIVGPAGNPRGPALIGLTGSMLSGLAYMAVRKLSNTEHTLTILVWFPLATIPLSFIWAARRVQPRFPSPASRSQGTFSCFSPPSSVQQL